MAQFAQDIGFPMTTLGRLALEACGPPEGPGRKPAGNVGIPTFAKDIGYHRDSLNEYRKVAHQWASVTDAKEPTSGPPTGQAGRKPANAQIHALREFADAIGFPEATLRDYRKVAHQWASVTDAKEPTSGPPTKGGRPSKETSESGGFTMAQFAQDIGFPQQTLSDYRRPRQGERRSAFSQEVRL